jgi:hypothetical protein
VQWKWVVPKTFTCKRKQHYSTKKIQRKRLKTLTRERHTTKLERMSANPILISQSNVRLLTKKPLLLHESDYEASWCFYYSSWKESDCRGGERKETKLGGGRKKAE